eukprot:SAG31_NODE_36022_length_317_cov_0.912844_1_plen_27_part_10
MLQHTGCLPELPCRDAAAGRFQPAVDF